MLSKSVPGSKREPTDKAAMTIKSQSMKTAWLVVFLLAPVALLNYLDRQMLASMKFSVMSDIKDIGNDTQWGIMLAQFKWVYALCSPIGGFLADRYSRRWIIFGSLFAWSAITWWTGHADSYHTLLWTRTAMGVSEAFYIPAALALIVDYHVGASKSRAVGIHTAAIYVGIIIGGFAGIVADEPSLGWRFAFSVTGALGVLYSLPLLYFLRDARTNQTTNSELTDQQPNNNQKSIISLKSLITSPSFLLLALYFTLVAMPGWMMKDWMPSMLKDQFNISQGKAGVSAGLYVNLAGFVGLFIGGYCSDRWVRRHLRGRTFVSAIGMATLIPALYGLGHSQNLSVAIVFLALFGLGFGLYDCNNMPILSQLVRPEIRATGYGIMNFLSVSVGGFADIGVGKLKDRGASFETILGIGAILVAINVFLILQVKPKKELTPELEQ